MNAYEDNNRPYDSNSEKGRADHVGTDIGSLYVRERFVKK